jgi:hypothetical protein
MAVNLTSGGRDNGYSPTTTNAVANALHTSLYIKEKKFKTAFENVTIFPAYLTVFSCARTPARSTIT